MHDFSMKKLAYKSVLTYMLSVTKLDELKRHLKPGQAYRLADLARWSRSVDRHARELVENGTLKKVSGGLYVYPKETAFGPAPASDKEVVRAFLKDDTFLLASPNAYNSLGVGTTQLYDKTVVYNHKRHGEFRLGNRTFAFRVKPRFPKALTKEFLLVDLVNNVDHLAEAKDQVLKRVAERAAGSDPKRLRHAVRAYGSERAKKFFERALRANELHVG
ncbi:hypothetical protein ABIE89_000551 [Bradyrhizobium niftali]|uniref:hypothetical protein n=1 Tax=Bradyrhizobium niftali TaxID=2560055 RepID=UPI00383752DA